MTALACSNAMPLAAPVEPRAPLPPARPDRAPAPLRYGVTTLGCDAGRAGIGRYTTELIRALAALPGARPEVVAHVAEAGVYCPPGLDPGLDLVGVRDAWRPPLASLAWHQLQLPGLCAERGWEVLLLPAANRRLPWRLPCPSVGTIHDYSLLHVGAKYDRAREAYIRHVLPVLARRLTRAITISESSRRDVLEHAGLPEERVHVVPLGVDHQRFFPADREAARATVAGLGLRRPYVLYVSRLEHPGKNHVRLIAAFETWKRRSGAPHVLVLAGPDWNGAAAVHAAAAASHYAEEIAFLGFVPGAALPDLYRAADLLVFPSLYEGFGLPVLEAMACGTPVACSNRSSLPEVAGDAALLFDPFDEEGLAQALTDVLDHPGLARELARRGQARAAAYSWQRTATETLAVLRQACEEGHR